MSNIMSNLNIVPLDLSISVLVFLNYLFTDTRKCISHLDFSHNMRKKHQMLRKNMRGNLKMRLKTSQVLICLVELLVFKLTGLFYTQKFPYILLLFNKILIKVNFAS